MSCDPSQSSHCFAITADEGLSAAQLHPFQWRISTQFPYKFHTISTKFPHNFHTVSTNFPHNFHTVSTQFSHNFNTTFMQFSQISGKFPHSFRSLRWWRDPVFLVSTMVESTMVPALHPNPPCPKSYCLLIYCSSESCCIGCHLSDQHKLRMCRKNSCLCLFLGSRPAKFIYN